MSIVETGEYPALYAKDCLMDEAVEIMHEMLADSEDYIKPNTRAVAFLKKVSGLEAKS
jgi:hypothetical protein